MKSFKIFLVSLVVVVVLLLVAILIFWAGIKIVSTNKMVQAESVKIANGANGQYLTDSKGMALYYFTKDTAGVSNCSGACASIWPIFYTSNLVIASPLQQSDFKTIIGAEGRKQTTYKGQPLYYYSKDTAAGNILGDGFGGVWFLVKP